MPNRRLRLWHYQLALIILCALAWMPRLNDPSAGFLGGLDQALTDLKFRFRGPITPSGKIVLIDIDSRSIEALGRWPWRRDYLALLVDQAFSSGAATVGLDIAFPEKQLNPDTADPLLRKVFQKHNGKVTLAWITEKFGEAFCESSPPVLPPGETEHPYLKNDRNVPCFSDPILNIKEFSEVAPYQGSANSARDEDGVIRETNFFVRNREKYFPSFALAFAARALGRPVKEAVPFAQAPIAYLGPENMFPSLSAVDLLQRKERDIASENIDLRGKHVLIGISAIAVGDRIATPFSPSVAGFEIQATIAEQILSQVFPERRPLVALVISLALALLLIAMAARVESFLLTGLFIVSVGLFWALDFFFLFPRNQHWPTAIVYANTGLVFISTFVGRYYQELASRKFFKAAFSRYVSPQVVTRLAASPETLKLGGEKKEVTILFCDLKGFTTFSEKLDPAQVAQLLNAYFTLLTDVVFRYDGTVDKYIGDSLMAFFGAPLSQPDHAARACAAALEMLGCISRERENFKLRFGVEIDVGIGINSGLVSVGNMGAEQRLSYTVIGDNVNTASRLESATRLYQVSLLATKNTIDAIRIAGKMLPFHRTIDLVKVKGKSLPIEIVQISHEPWDEEKLALFDQGRELYRNRKWQDAIKSFRRSDPADGPCQYFINRCESHMRTPPDQDWDGVNDLSSK
jgi:adenylate cyclase